MLKLAQQTQRMARNPRGNGHREANGAKSKFGHFKLRGSEESGEKIKMSSSPLPVA